MPTLQKNFFGELYTRANTGDGFATIHFTDEALKFFSKTKIGDELPSNWRSATQSWQYFHNNSVENKVINARCPVCDEKCYFYQNEYGSKVFFDEVGGAWKKHPCTITKELVKSWGKKLKKLHNNNSNKKNILDKNANAHRHNNQIEKSNIVLAKAVDQESEKKQQDTIQIYKKNKNPKESMVYCPYCNAKLKKKNLDKHLRTRCPKFNKEEFIIKNIDKLSENNDEIKMTCCKYCNKIVPEATVEHHIDNNCPKSEQGIKRIETQERRQRHVNELIQCTYCHRMVKFKMLGTHVRKSCSGNPAKKT